MVADARDARRTVEMGISGVHMVDGGMKGR